MSSIKDKAIFYIDRRGASDKSIEELSKLKNFDGIYEGFSYGVFPRDGYVAQFTVQSSSDMSDIAKEMSRLKLSSRLWIAGPMIGPAVKEKRSK